MGTLGGNTGNAESINDADEVVGEADLPGVSGSQLHHAVFWQHGVMTDLGTQDGDPCSLALSINSRGQRAWSIRRPEVLARRPCP